MFSRARSRATRLLSTPGPLTSRLHTTLTNPNAAAVLPRISRAFSNTAATQQPVAKTKPFYITTPIFYVNGAPHIGHLYTALLGDAMARWHRACGQPTHLMGGTDEHGGKVAEAAEKAGAASVQAFCDTVSASFSDTWPVFDVRMAHYARTTDAAHKAQVQRFWRVLADRGFIYKGAHEGWYCRSDETFYPENQVVTADDGRKLSPTNHPVEWVSEPNYKFRLSAFEAPLRSWLVANPSVVQPAARYNEVMAFLDTGLEDISVSRLASKVAWGVPVPGDEEHTVYVWLDALSVYLSSA